MADLAREEADRYFSSRPQRSAHPEDEDDRSTHSSDDQPESANDNYYHSDPGTDDEDVHHHNTNMATMTSTRNTYYIPAQTHYANTGPKGVIADAQSYARAKQSTFRKRMSSFAGNLTSRMTVPSVTEKTEQRKTLSGSPPKSTSSDLSDEDADSQFMETWRASRLQELASLSQAPQRRQSPSRRTWGTFVEVDANGYLDAVEKVPEDTVVVVMIYDPSSSASAEVEDELSMLAYKHNKTRFVRLHHEIAEMQSIEVPALLAYKAGDVFATISGAKAEGLEGVLLSLTADSSASHLIFILSAQDSCPGPGYASFTLLHNLSPYDNPSVAMTEFTSHS
ncbi:hypothetical protein HRR78_005502 [Exophiala dermatitidis]|nr:hypothetical protein HRR78_005502 [Exophiala dermatitidis]